MREIFQKEIIVRRIAIQSATISMSADNGECKPKKRIDQRTFKASWAEKILIAVLTLSFLTPLCQTKASAIPMSAKSVVQTGPKIHDGGLNEGLITFAYQFPIEGVVKIEPIIPASSQNKIEAMILKVFVFIK